MIPRSPAAEPQWPPRSPGEVLLSTPGGRARLRHLEAVRTSPSPIRSTRTFGRGLESMDCVGGEEDEEDEETLQLQLEEIQAKLRLKKLQASKAQKLAGTTPTLRGSASWSVTNGPAGSGAATSREPQSPQRSTIEVPASPVRRATSAATAAAQKSPKRVLLGIDKGLRGQDVSLRRPPTSRRGLTGSSSSSTLRDRAGGGSVPSQRESHCAATRPLSFNERLAAARSEEAARHDKLERIQKLRTSAFSVGKDEMSRYKEKAVDIPVVEKGPEIFSRDDILRAASGKKPHDDEHGRTTLPRRSNTTPNIRSKYTGDSAAPATNGDTVEGANAEEASFEPYSSFHLSRRILPHSVVARSLSGMTMYAIQDLLRLVKKPHFELPDVETDVVVFGIIAEKTDPRSHIPTGSSAGSAGQQQDRGKYMKLMLVDLTYEIDLFLFKSGFDRFWKLSTGTVIAILNPGIMPPPPGRQDTGKWSLVINSDADTILEIGNARDLGYCKSIKRDGHQCSSWINAKRTEFCEYHTNEAAKKMRATRNDLNGAAGFGHQEKSFRGGRGGRGGGPGRGGGQRGGRGDAKHQDRGYDYFTNSQWFAAGTGAASLIDSEALDGGYADKVERQEGIKRRLAAKERETEIARKLGELGSGAGRDYMKLAGRDQSQQVAVAAAKGAASMSSTASSSSATWSSQHSQLSSSSSLATVGTAAEQAAASRASLLMSLAERRSTSAASAMPSLGSSGLHIRHNTPKLGPPEPAAASAAAGALGPAKRKRPPSALSTSTSSTGAGTGRSGRSGLAGTPADDSRRNGLGWGSNLQAKLGRMKDGERLTDKQGMQNEPEQSAAAAATATSAVTDTAKSTRTGSALTPVIPAAERSPVRKKTRFLLGGKGIREAGRESLGTIGAEGDRGPADDDEEDELVII
ncbi:hypothetical protein SEPCBS119000_002783 [Sporothrix epigloea]|uniref:Zinc finger Mcm10/DnaG-type domain-containing protein n=1 Tax=Sporothrix epigloea TaxID=1892477 RepID=A0ABP0DLC6_9PEZI